MVVSKKVVLVTGSSRGIGFKIAERFYLSNHDVIFNSRKEKDLIDICNKFPGSLGIASDVTDHNEAQILVQKIISLKGKIDIVICNVGSGKSASPGNETREDWQKSFSLNLWSTTNIVEATKKYLTKSKGVIICISSICGLEVVKGAPLTYSASKAALHSYVKGLSNPFGKLGIRINAIALGNIIFSGSTWSQKLKENHEKVKNMLYEEVSVSRFGKPEEVADLVEFMTLENNSFINGSIWTLDGGQVRGW